MANFSVQGSITVKRLRTGASLSLTLDVTGALAQVVNVDTGDVTPDWTQEENQPVVTPRVSVTPTASVIITVDEDSGQGWWYNSTQLTFSETNLTGDGWMIEEGEGRFAYNSDTHALRIIKNLASKDNYASDTLQFVCTVTYEGNEYEMSASVTIAIMTGGTSGYNGYLQAETQILDDEHTSTKIRAYLWNGDSSVQKFSTKWYAGQVADGYEFEPHTDYKTDTEDGTAYVTVDRDDVNGGNNNDGTASGGTLFICQFFNEEGSQVATRGINIVDEADEYTLMMTISEGTTLDAGDVTVKATIWSLSQLAEPSNLTDAEYKLTVLQPDLTELRSVTTNEITLTAADSLDGNDVNVVGEATFKIQV